MSRQTRGFTLVELLITTAIAMCVMAAVVALVGPAHAIFAAQPEVSDMQQRLRVGVDALEKDLLTAGAGVAGGPLPGPFAQMFPAILPFRVGESKPDSPGAFFDDRLSVVYAPALAAQASLAFAMAVPSTLASSVTSCVLSTDPASGCRAPDGSCGFREGMLVVVVDGTAAWDAFAVDAVQGAMLQLRHLAGTSKSVYRAGAAISQIVMRTYWLKIDAASETFQLMRYDGLSTDVPMLDNVVALSFEYAGDADPPQLRGTGPESTTYGPKPPPLDQDDEMDMWGLGENCVFARDGDVQIPRLERLGSGGLVRLSSRELSDGPWCPDAAAAGRYDADLLRIRRVRVTLRVQATGTFRGKAGPLFARRGTSQGGPRFLPDREVVFDVTPRNLNLAR